MVVSATQADPNRKKKGQKKMKKFSFAKIVSLIFVCAMLMCAFTVIAFADNTQEAGTVVEIVSNNVYYGEKYQLMFAVNAPEGAELSATDSKGNALTVVPFAEDPNPTINGVACKAYIIKEGVAAQAIDEVVTLTVKYNGVTAKKSYSVLQYIYERTQGVSANQAEGTEREMFNTLLAYANASDIHLNGATEEDCIANYKYVTVEGGTLDGSNVAGMFLPGATPFKNIVSNRVLGVNEGIMWEVYSNGDYVGTYEYADMRDLEVIYGNMTVVATIVELECSHEWTDATCTAPKTCKICSATDGDPLGHDFAEATCTEPQICRDCGAIGEGAYGHELNDATCTEPKTCKYCDYTEGDALGHSWNNATCEDPKTCSECGETEGDALGHDWADATCQAPKTCKTCGATEGDAVECNDGDGDGKCDSCGTILSYNEVTIPEAAQLADGAPVKVSGTVVSIDTPWNDQYNNITVTIQDAEGNKFTLYRLGTNVVKGDIIIATGVIGSHNDVKQLAQGGLAEITGHDDSYDVGPVEMTVAEALEAVDGTDVIVTGTVIRIDTAWSDSHGNISVTIRDENGDDLYIYRLETKVELYDIITVTGAMGTYNNARQIAAGATAEIVGTHECTKFTEATCTELAKCVICDKPNGELAAHNYVNGICTVCGLGEGVSTSENKYTFGDYAAGTQYAENEEHVLDSVVTVITTQCHFTSELRIYSSSAHDGYAIIKSETSITKIALNAGNNADTLVVYGSNDDGATWTELAKISVTGTYTDYEADLGGSYKWIKLDVAGTLQVRLKSITLTTISCPHSSTTTYTTDATCTEAGYEVTACAGCGKVISKEEVESALGHSYGDGEETTAATCTKAGVMTYTCSTCGDTKEEEIEALGHTTEQGVCGNCGQEIGGATTPDEPAAPTWQIATELNVGDTIVIVCVSKGMELTSVGTAGSYGSGTAYSGTPNGTYQLTVVAGYANGTVAFQDGSGKYLSWSSKNTLVLSETLNANSSWTVDFSGDNAKILNAYDASRNLQWNASSPRFACYASAQTAIDIFVLK